MFETVHEVLTAVTSTDKSRPELEHTISELSRVESHAVERRLALTAAIDDLHDGGIDAETVTRVKTKRSKNASRSAARTAAQLKHMPRTRQALARGEITEEHAEAAAEAAQRVSPEEVDADLSPDAARQPADRFARQARSWATAREREHEKEARQARQRAAREARMWTNAQGMWCLYAEFDPVEGATVKKAFDAQTDRLWRADGGHDGRPDEIRTPDQRRADALAGLITQPAAPATAKQPHPKTTIIVRVDADRCRDDQPNGIAELVDGTPIPQTTLERLACGSDFIGAVFAGNGAILWQGRRKRTATDDQWTALIARDGGCVCCGTDPAHCEAHHLQPWAPPTNGPTNIDTMALVCTNTHHLIHDHGYTLENIAGLWQLRPPSRAPNQQPHAA